MQFSLEMKKNTRVKFNFVYAGYKDEYHTFYSFIWQWDAALGATDLLFVFWGGDVRLTVMFIFSPRVNTFFLQASCQANGNICTLYEAS